MPDDRTLSLGTIFTANVNDFLKGIGRVRNAMNQLNQSMSGPVVQRAKRSMTDFGRVMDTLRQRYRAMRNVNRTYNRSLAESVRMSDKSVGAIKDAIGFHDKLSKTVYAHARSLQAAGKDGRAYAKTVDYVALKNGVLNKELKMTSNGFVNVAEQAKEAAKAQSWVGRQIAKVQGAYNRLLAALKVTAAYSAAGIAIYQIVNALQAGVSEIIQFDQALKNLQAITGATDQEIRAMSETIKHVASTTKFSTVEVADAMVLLGQSGFSAAESINAIQAVSDLATGTLTDMRTTTDLLTTAIRAFGKEAFQASEIADIMANAINKSKLTIEKLRIAFNYVGPAAYAAGINLEEVAASMMALANSGLRASTIGTGLRQIFSRLVAPSARLKEAFEANNIELDDINIRLHGFSGVLMNLKDLFMDTRTGLIDARKAFELFGLRGANAILALIKATETGDFQKFLGQVYEVGTASKMAGIQIEGLGLKVKNLMDRLKRLAVEIGERGFSQIFGAIIDGLKAATSAMTDFVRSSEGAFVTSWITRIIATLSVVLALRLGFTALWWIAKKIISAFMFLGKGIGAFAFVLTGVIQGVGALDDSLESQRETLQDNRMELEKNVDMLKFYMRSLRDAYKAMQENESLSFRYEAVIKRLKQAFPDLAKEIDNVKDSYEDLTDLLERQKDAMRMEEIENAIKLLGENEKSLERLKGKAGAYKIISDKLGEWKDKWGDFVKEQRETPAHHPAEKMVKGIVTSIDEAIPALQDFFGSFVKGMQAEYQDHMSWLARSAEETDEIKARIVENTEDVKKVGLSWAKFYADRTETIEEAVNELQRFMTERNIPENEIKIALDEARYALEEFRKEAKEPYQVLGIESPFASLMREANTEQQQALQKLHKQMEAEISTFRDWAQKHPDIAGDVFAKIEGIRLKFTVKMAETIRGEGIQEEKLQALRLIWIDELGKEWLAYYEKVRAAEHTYYTRRLTDVQGNREREKQIADKAEKVDLKRMRQREGMEEAHQSKKTKQFIETEASRKAWERASWSEHQALKLSKLRSYLQEEVSLRKTASEQAEVEISKTELEFQEERMRQALANLAFLSQKREENHKEIFALEKEILQITKDVYQARANVITADSELTREILRRESDYMEDYWRAGWVTSDQYFAHVHELWMNDMITFRQYEQEKTRIYGSMWDNFLMGIDRAKQALMSFGDLFAKIGEDLPEVFADNALDAFDDIIEGTKNTGEAFRDMAVDMLKWISRMILKLLIMKAITAALGSSGGIFGSLFGGGQSTPYIPARHEGGIVGRDPAPVRIVNPAVFTNAMRYHDGLRPDEEPAILKKGEGVFTPEQMKAMGGTTTINVPVYVDDSMLASKLRTNIEETVRKTLRQEMH